MDMIHTRVYACGQRAEDRATRTDINYDAHTVQVATAKRRAKRCAHYSMLALHAREHCRLLAVGCTAHSALIPELRPTLRWADTYMQDGVGRPTADRAGARMHGQGAKDGESARFFLSAARGVEAAGRMERSEKV